MNAREKLDEFAEINGMNKNQLIGWSIAADFAEWYAEQVKNRAILDVLVGRSEQLFCGRNITTCVFYKNGGKCSNPEDCRDQIT